MTVTTATVTPLASERRCTGRGPKEKGTIPLHPAITLRPGAPVRARVATVHSRPSFEG